MRSFSKKLAFVLAAAMVFTSFAPAAKAEAAKEMVINKSSQILYVTDGDGINDAAQVGGGKGNVSEYDFYVKNKPSDWKKTLKFEWSSSDEDVATVNQSGLTTAVGVGKATISCKITDKAGDVVTTSKVKVTVKANAAEVKIKNASKISGTVLELKDGKATLDLDRIMSDAAGNETTKRGTYVTDYTEWLYEPKTGVEVSQSNGVFTFTAAGEYKLSCRTYQSSKYTKTTAESEQVVVTVVDKTFEAKNTTRDDVELTFAGAADITAADVTIKEIVKTVKGTEKVDYLIKGVTANADKTVYTVATFYEFNDGAEYEVSVDGYETMTFTASKGVPKKIVLYTNKDNAENRVVTVGANTQILYKLYDANDVDVTLGTAAERQMLSFKIKYVEADYEDYSDYLYFYEAGNRAIVTAEYHTFNYDEEGNEVGYCASAPFTFTAVNKSVAKVEGVTDFTTNANFGWGKTQDIKKSDVGSLGVKIKIATVNNPVEVYAYNTMLMAGETELGRVNFTSLNPDVLQVYADPTDYSAKLDARKADATGYIMVSYVLNINGVDVPYPIQSIAIKVKADSVLNSGSLNNKTLTISSNPVELDQSIHSQAVENPAVKLTTKDQYGVAYNAVNVAIKGANELSKKTTGETGANGFTIGTTSNGDTWITLDTTRFAAILEEQAVSTAAYYAMSFRYTVEATTADGKKVTDSLTVNVRRPNATSSDAVEVSNPVVSNIAITSENDNSKAVKKATFAAYVSSNGAKIDEIAFQPMVGNKETAIANAVSGTYYYVVKKDGNVITSASNVRLLQNGNGNKVEVTFADTTGGPNGCITYKNTEGLYGSSTIGAGTYTFELYKAVEKYNSTDLQWAPVSGSGKSVTVTCNEGTYGLASRDKTVVNVLSEAELLKCFTFKDRFGNVGKYDGDVVKFNNTARNYTVVYDDEALNRGSVFVQKVIFFEEFNGLKADYEVAIGNFVKINQVQ